MTATKSEHPNEVRRSRTARQRHRCAGTLPADECTGWIEPGQTYVEGTALPGHDATDGGFWRLRWHHGCTA